MDTKNIGRKTVAGLVFLLTLILFGQPVWAAKEQPQDALTASDYSLSEEELEELLDFVREKWDAGEFSDKEDIRDAITEGEQKFGVTLEESVRDQLTDALYRLDGLGLDHDAAIAMAKKLYRDYGDEITEKFQGLYEQYGDALAENVKQIVEDQSQMLTDSFEKALKEQVVEPAKETAKTTVENTAKAFFRDLKDSVVSFFRTLTERK